MNENSKKLHYMDKDYVGYFKLDVASALQTIQDVNDNMLTRLEELSSVVQIIKQRNSDCHSAVSDDISKFRGEITILSKKIATLSEIVKKLSNNMDIIEKQVEVAELDYEINNEYGIKSFLKPLLKINKEVHHLTTVSVPEKVHLDSVLYNFEHRDIH